MKRWQRLICLFIFSISTVTIAATDDLQYQLSFSSQQTNGIPILTAQEHFDCSSQIYSIINASNLADKPVEATVVWRNPAGEVQEQTPISLYPVEGKALGWAWLKLHKASGAALLSFIDSSIGMDEFIGDWDIELRIDNKRVASGSFNVLC